MDNPTALKIIPYIPFAEDDELYATSEDEDELLLDPEANESGEGWTATRDLNKPYSPVWPDVPSPAPAKKRRRGRPKGSKNKTKAAATTTKKPSSSVIDIELEDEEEEELDELEDEDEAPRKRQARGKANIIKEEVDDATIQFTAYIYIAEPRPTSAATSKGKQKKTGTDAATIIKGPILFDTNTTFQSFRNALAKDIPCAVKALPQDKIMWQLESPATSTRKPLHNNAGYTAMVKSLNTNAQKKGGPGCLTVFIHMPPPILQVGWDTGDCDFVANPYDHSLALSQGEPEAIDLSAKAQIASISQHSTAYINELRAKYPVGNHTLFPNKRVLQMTVGDQVCYWDLTDLRLTIWASHLSRKASGVSFTTPPNSKHFDVDQSMKPPAKKAAAMDENQPPTIALGERGPGLSHPPSTGPFSAPNMGFQGPFYPGFYPPFPLPYYPPPSYPFYGPGLAPNGNQVNHLPNPFMAHNLNHRHRGQVDHHGYPKQGSPTRPSFSSSIPSISLGEFCQKYSISETDKDKLALLEYVPGHRAVVKLSRDDFTAAGFTVLGWERFLEAHHHFLSEN